MKLKVGEKLLKIRVEKKLSQNEFAELIGMSQSAYGRLEKGETMATLEQLTNFSKQLDVPLQEFLPETLIINNHNSGPVGVNFGTYNVYSSDNELFKSIQDQNKLLQDKVKLLEEMIEVLKEKLDKK